MEKRQSELEWLFPKFVEDAQLIPYVEVTECRDKCTDSVTISPTKKAENAPTTTPTTADKCTDNRTDKHADNVPTTTPTTADKYTDNVPTNTPTNTPTTYRQEPTIEPVSVIFIDSNVARVVGGVSKVTVCIVAVLGCGGLIMVVLEWLIGIAEGVVFALTGFLADVAALAKQGVMIVLCIAGVFVAWQLFRYMCLDTEGVIPTARGVDATPRMPNGVGNNRTPNIQVTINTGDNVTQHNH